MKDVTFVTSNLIKFRGAEQICKQYSINILRDEIELDEIQADGETIARKKAEQAFNHFNKPILVTDDTWSIPGLNGFPGAFMKQMNGWFTAEDWLHLTLPLADRRIILEQHAVYQDGAEQKYFMTAINGTLLTQISGANSYTHNTIVQFDGSDFSQAHLMEHNLALVPDGVPTVWHQIADYLHNRND